jgi:GntR family transcriptional regulator, rspAB operon transcriptional repressor
MEARRMVELVRVDTMTAYDRIKEKIISLQLGPGAPIDEGALAEELNLATSAVREALKLLAHDNLVMVTARHGIRVAEANPEDLRQLFEMRLPLESMCARMAAERATSDDIAVMEALGREYASARAKRDLAHLLDLDHRYHRALTDAAHNRYMKETLERFFGLSERLWHLAMPQIDWLVSGLDRHGQIVRAIEVQDGSQAAALMSEHVLDFQKRVEQALGVSK